jgi:uncharacterized coiled-coil DUF342 family protein
MLEELDSLAGKLTELNARVRLLREENLQLRAQVTQANGELDALRGKVAGAMQRIDALLERLPERLPEVEAGANASSGER